MILEFFLQELNSFYGMVVTESFKTSFSNLNLFLLLSLVKDCWACGCEY